MKNKNVILWIVTAGVFLEIMDASIVNVAIYTLVSVFNTTIHKAQLISSAYMFALGIFTPLSIWVSKRFSIRNVLIFSFCVFGVGSLLCGLTKSIDLLIVFRCLQSFGAAFMLPIARIFIRTNYKNSMVKTTSTVAIVFLTAYAVGPLVGGYIVSRFGWSMIFIVNIPLVILCLIILLTCCSNVIKTNLTVKFDLMGYFTYAIFVASFMMLSNTIVVNVILFAVMIICVIYYINHLKRVSFPILSKKLFLNKAFMFQSIISFLIRAAIVQILFIIPLFLQYKYHLSIEKSALIVACYAPGAIITRSILTHFMSINMKKLIIMILILQCCFGLLPFFFNTYYVYAASVLIFLTGCTSTAIFSRLNSQSLLVLTDEIIEEGSVFYSSILQLSGGFGLCIINFANDHNYHYKVFMTSILLVLCSIIVLKFSGLNNK